MQVKPLNQIPRHRTTPASIDNYSQTLHVSNVTTHDKGDIVCHSKHRLQHSQHYHKVVASDSPRFMDSGASGLKKISKLNPNNYAPRVTSYPGLAN
jgi:hypothetical protein